MNTFRSVRMYLSFTAAVNPRTNKKEHTVQHLDHLRPFSPVMKKPDVVHIQRLSVFLAGSLRVYVGCKPFLRSLDYTCTKTPALSSYDMDPSFVPVMFLLCGI